jgi:holo-[acyl-carrier protein] synthase
MIVGIGCDIVEHNITISLGWSSNPRMLQRVFSPKELDLYEIHKTDKFLSGRFAGKEAILKCLGTGMKDGIALTDIQILQTQQGKPFIVLEGEVKRIAEQMGINSWHISISHSISTSMSFVIAEGNDGLQS